MLTFQSETMKKIADLNSTDSENKGDSGNNGNTGNSELLVVPTIQVIQEQTILLSQAVLYLELIQENRWK